MCFPAYLSSVCSSEAFSEDGAASVHHIEAAQKGLGSLVLPGSSLFGPSQETLATPINEAVFKELLEGAMLLLGCSLGGEASHHSRGPDE